MRIEFVLSGTKPLLCHNPQMVDPEFELNREIKALTSKRKKTDADLKQVERLEWYGGLYTGEIDGRFRVTQPSAKVRKCLINTGKITKQGKQVERAVTMLELNVPLIYEGSEAAADGQEEIDRLYHSPVFHSRLSVGIGNKRVMRVRPQFVRWALVVPALFVTDAGLNLDELVRLVELAGVVERIGDNRVNGYGAFKGAVRTENQKPIKPTLAGVAEFFKSFEKKESA